MIQQIDYYVIAPPLVLALVAALVLLLDAFLPARPGTRTALGLVTLAGVAISLAFVVAQALSGGPPRSTFCVPPNLAGPAGQGPAMCSFVADRFTLVFAGMVLVAAVVVVLMSMTQLADGGIPVGEWYFLLLCTLVGAITLPASRDLVMLVVALELVSLPVFALTAMKRYDGRASEAAVKLFVVSVVSTAIMLFGVSLLYGIAGAIYLSRLAAVFSGQIEAPGVDPALVQGLPAVVTVGVVLVVAGFAFKIAAVPFHSWAADVYQGASVPVAALLSVISKAAGFAGLILVLVVGLSGQAATWAPIIGIVAALTMTAGNLLAMRQRSAVRLLAWSSVAQSGYILAPLAITAASGAVGTSMAYLVIYAAMNLGAFAVVMLISRTVTRNELDDYRGLAFRSPAAGLALAFCLVCLAGLPPGLAGLFAKVFVFRELVVGGSGWLALIMAVNTVIGLYYYATWTARLFTPTPGTSRAPTSPIPSATGESLPPASPTPHRPPATTWLAIGLALVVAVLFSFAPQVVLDMTSLSAFG
ncbi:NADH-quinone oxidoreductase subunit N [Nonomuraea jiangxiensis]|uniref:NADH-quinone oxidoreductase subunit N n=1 Tax=Nonomuraea jiangxiensis TaxID=633440 RepID=A0A1G8MCQ0_9ACTN|nr:NADH-quinone oxidoreductase subunit N [Nonomuraea jiangxiensis]SDI65150.1 NADH-quinone oxidoreductase subunit N [Nonomuraea jiangxiensis]